MHENSVPLERIKRYDIVRLIGEGAKGKVYLATDRIIRRPVAIKVFSLDSLTGEKAPRVKIMREFFLETQTAGALLHPNIVVIYDVGKQRDVLYIVMEFVFGKTILQHQQLTGLSIKKSIEIIYELALALDYAHSKGVVHRDIKPENVILSANGVPKITDFGIARFRKHLKDEKRALVGSTRFIAPEQILQMEQDHRVDIYQLGVVLYELLTRHALFRGKTPHQTLTRICTETPPPPSAINHEVPEDLDCIVSRCVEKSPSRRFQRARELADALAECLRTSMHGGMAYDRELMKRLKKFELFSLFSDHEIQQLLEAGEFVTCRQGEQIIKENEADSDFFVLLDGNVRVQKQQRVLSNFLPGSCFGEIGAFARRRRSAAVIADEDCRLLRINALLFQGLNPAVQLKMLNTVVRNLSSLVISLDNEIMHLTDGKGRSDKLPSICPLCGYDNQAPIEVCPHCGVIPSACENVVSDSQSGNGTTPPHESLADTGFLPPEE